MSFAADMAKLLARFAEAHNANDGVELITTPDHAFRCYGCRKVWTLRYDAVNCFRSHLRTIRLPVAQMGQPQPCVRCGMQCLTAPCIYGEWNADKSRCRYLIDDEADKARGIETYNCQKYEEIKAKESLGPMPMFGSGCCGAMGNTRRNKVIAAKLRLGILDVKFNGDAV
jgi:hypothetical protein